jgi:hypothetical protein
VIQTSHIPNQEIHKVGEKPLIKTSSSSPILPFPLTLAFSSAKVVSKTFWIEEKVPKPFTSPDSYLSLALAKRWKELDQCFWLTLTFELGVLLEVLTTFHLGSVTTFLTTESACKF